MIYLGHEISKNGIQTDGHKVKAIKNWAVPIMVTELRSFLGFTNYYRCFIKGYAKDALPLYDQISSNNATHKKWKIQWTDECQKAFDRLKVLCTSVPILAFADFTKPFKLHTNVSTIGLCGILYQELNGKDRVIMYASRALSKSKSHYPAHKLEFLALKWAAIESFQEYLYGNTFATYSNNNPLTYVLTTIKVDVTGHRWIAKLVKFNFTVHYHSGKSNIEVDALSAIPWDQNVRADMVKAIFKAAVESPGALMEIYACHKKAISSLILESPPAQMTILTGFRPRRQIQLLTR